MQKAETTYPRYPITDGSFCGSPQGNLPTAGSPVNDRSAYSRMMLRGDRPKPPKPRD